MFHMVYDCQKYKAIQSNNNNNIVKPKITQKWEIWTATTTTKSNAYVPQDVCGFEIDGNRYDILKHFIKQMYNTE